MNAPAGTFCARARRDGLDVGNRRRVLERRVVAGADAEQDDVIVVVDEPGDDRASVQVDGACAGAEALPAAARAHRREAPVLDRHLAHGAAAGVHRDDVAVDQAQVAGAGAGRRGALAGQGGGEEQRAGEHSESGRREECGKASGHGDQIVNCHP
jgi:hypothetical protein